MIIFKKVKESWAQKVFLFFSSSQAWKTLAYIKVIFSWVNFPLLFLLFLNKSCRIFVVFLNHSNMIFKDCIFTILGLYDLKQWSSEEKHRRVSLEALNTAVTQLPGAHCRLAWALESWPWAVSAWSTPPLSLRCCPQKPLFKGWKIQIAQSRASITSV